LSVGTTLISAVFIAVSAGTIMVLNSQLNEIQGSLNTKHIRYSAVSSFIIWGLVLIKSIGSLLSSLSDSHPQVSSTKSRNWYLLCVIGLFTGLKG
jgi:hypothetical protein